MIYNCINLYHTIFYEEKTLFKPQFIAGNFDAI